MVNIMNMRGHMICSNMFFTTACKQLVCEQHNITLFNKDKKANSSSKIRGSTIEAT